MTELSNIIYKLSPMKICSENYRNQDTILKGEKDIYYDKNKLWKLP